MTTSLQCDGDGDGDGAVGVNEEEEVVEEEEEEKATSRSRQLTTGAPVPSQSTIMVPWLPRRALCAVFPCVHAICSSIMLLSSAFTSCPVGTGGVWGGCRLRRVLAALDLLE